MYDLHDKVMEQENVRAEYLHRKKLTKPELKELYQRGRSMADAAKRAAKQIKNPEERESLDFFVSLYCLNIAESQTGYRLIG